MLVLKFIINMSVTDLLLLLFFYLLFATSVDFCYERSILLRAQTFATNVAICYERRLLLRTQPFAMSVDFCYVRRYLLQAYTFATNLFRNVIISSPTLTLGPRTRSLVEKSYFAGNETYGLIHRQLRTIGMHFDMLSFQNKIMVPSRNDTIENT